MREGSFKIGTLAKLTGFGVATLRNWERRYGLLKPVRVSSGHRLYTAEDLATLQRAKALLDEGRSIGEIAVIGRDTLLTAEPASERPDTLHGMFPGAVLDALPCGVVLTDAHGKTLWVNRSLERLCGYGQAELHGRTPGSVLQGPETDKATARRIGEAVAQLRPCSARILNYAASERAYWAELEIAPVFADAEPRGFVATVREVSAEVDAHPT